MKIFVTGGTGFIGSYVVKELADRGHTMSILARNPDKVPALVNLPGVTIVPGLLADFDVMEEAMKGCDAVIHIALGWGDHATSMLKNDTFPSVFLFETAARFGIKHFIYTSSTAAVANNPPGTDGEPPRPSDYYGATKAASEAYLMAAAVTSGMRSVVIRPGYTFGNPVIPGASMEIDDRFRRIVTKALDGSNMELIKNDGTQFIWAGDLAKIYAAVLESDVDRKTYFALGTTFSSWESIASQAISMAGSRSRILLEDRGYGDVPYLFDVTPLQRDFGLSFDADDKITDHISYLARQ